MSRVVPRMANWLYSYIKHKCRFFVIDKYESDKEAQFKTFLDQRARHILLYVYGIGGVIPAIFILFTYLNSPDTFFEVAKARLIYIVFWCFLFIVTFSKYALLSLRHSLMIYTFVGVTFITYLNSFLTQNQLFTVPTILMFLIGSVISQIGARIQGFSAVITCLVPLAVLNIKAEMSSEDVRVVVLLWVWSCISWLASIVIERGNRELFSSTLALKSLNEAKQVLLEKEAKSNQFKSQFLANMSHEIRTPLTAVLGNAENYFMYHNQHDKDLAVSTILNNGRHLYKIVNDILDLSKIEAGKLEIEAQETDVVALLCNLRQVEQSQAEAKQLKFTLDIQFPIPSLLITDPTRLNQILFNLTNNAIKFTERGEIKIKVHYDIRQQRLYCSIKDTGIGINEEAQRTLFIAFNQADNSHARRFGGTGLGLYICKGLVEKLGGEISLTSKENEGTLFSFYISARNVFSSQWYQETPKFCDIQPHNQSSNLQLKGVVLLAEDHDDNRRFIAQRLKTMGLTVIESTHGEDAAEKALLNKIDLILMDIQMPGMDGIEAVSIIRQHDDITPIVALTANAMKVDIEHYLTHGFNDHLSKPIDFKAFEKVLLKYLKPNYVATSSTLTNQGNIEENEEELDSDDLLFTLDNEAFLELVDEYRSGLPAVLETLQTAYQQDDWIQMQAVAHSIKGSAGNFGFNKITNAAAALELSANQKSHVAYQNLVIEIQTVLS